MNVRIAVTAALAAAGILLFLTRPAPDRGPQPKKAASDPAPSIPQPILQAPMFSPAYSQALAGAMELDEPAVARLEQQLTKNPTDADARVKLMAYYRRADQAVNPQNQAKRFRLAVWLIEHDPASELLHSPVSRLSPAEVSAANIERITNLWAAATKAHPQAAAVQWNVASFFEGWNPELYLQYLEATAAADPNHPFALRSLAYFYALTILGSGPLAPRARAGLEASKNVWVLGNAAYMLQSQHNLARQQGVRNTRAGELAERYFLRAKALDPKLDRQAILPQLDLKALALAKQNEAKERQEWAARFESAAGEIQRLPVTAFPELPSIIAKTLTSRNCRIPQPADSSAPLNVIQGDFRAAGETGWAALCSVNNTTSLLVFRHDRDESPETLDTSEDRHFLQGLGGDKIGYSRQITPATREFIVSHYRAYGGPKPPPIDHHGIDDAFLGKASSIRYFYQGKWLGLQGAD